MTAGLGIIKPDFMRFSVRFPREDLCGNVASASEMNGARRSLVQCQLAGSWRIKSASSLSVMAFMPLRPASSRRQISMTSVRLSGVSSNAGSQQVIQVIQHEQHMFPVQVSQ
jgi:hypothetical protein